MANPKKRRSSNTEKRVVRTPAAVHYRADDADEQPASAAGMVQGEHYDSMINGVLVIDSSGHINYANESALRILRLEKEEVLNRHFETILHCTDPSPRGAASAVAVALHEGKSVKHVQCRIGRPSWRVTSLLLNAAPLGGDGGQADAWVLSFIDISERIENAPPLDQWGSDPAPDTTFFIGPDWRLKSISGGAAAPWLGEYFLQPPVAEAEILALFPDSIRSSVEESLNNALNGAVVDRERVLSFPDRSVRHASFHYAPVKDALQAILGVSLTIKDLTAWRNAERQGRKSADQTRMLAALAEAGAWELNLSTWTFAWTEEVRGMHGVAPSFIPSFDEVLNLYTEDAQLLFTEAVAHCVSEGQPFDLTLQIATTTAARKWIRVVGMAERSNGKTTGVHGLIQDINDVRLREQELDRLALIARKTDNLVIVTDPDQKIQWVNDAFVRVTGFSVEEAVGKNPGDLLQGEETDKQTVAMVSEKLARHEPVKFEIVNYRKDGKKYWLDVEIQPIFNASGSLDAFIAIEADITHRKDAEASLMRSEAMFRDMANNVPGVVYRFHVRPDGSTYFSYLSDKVTEIFGLSREPLSRDWDLAANIPDEDKAGFLASVRHAVVNRTTWFYEGRMICGDGSIKWFQGRSNPTLSGLELVFNGILVDVTREKQYEQALAENNTQLRLAIDRFEMATAAGGFGIWELDLATNVLQADARCFELLKHPRIPGDQLLDYWFDHIHEGDKERVLAHFSESIRDRKEFRELFRWTCNDDRVIYLEAFAIVQGGDELAPKMVGVFSDVTTRETNKMAIQESEQRFRLASNTARLGVWEWHLPTGKLVWDDVLYDMLGFDIGTPMSFEKLCARMDADDLARLGAEIKSVTPESNVWESYFSIRIPSDGLVRKFQFTSIGEFNQKGELVKLTGVDIDVTEQIKRQQILDAISLIQSSFITESNPVAFFDFALSQILATTESERGFIGEVLYEEGVPFLKSIAITNINADAATQQLHGHDRTQGPEFDDLKPLIDAVMSSGEPVIANGLAGELGSGVWPVGHPSLNAFAGVPFYKGDKLIGLLGLANRSGGYSNSFLEMHHPLLETLGNIVEAYRGEQERKRSAQQLLLSEQRFKLAARVAQIGVYEWNIKTNATYFDETARGIFRMKDTPDDQIFETWYRGINPEHLASVREAMDRSVRYGEQHELIYPWQATTGESLIIHVNAVPILDEQGNTYAVMGVASDVTEEHLAAERLKESEQRFRWMADAAPVMIWISDADGRHAYFNKVYLDFTGRPMVLEGGDGWKDNVHPNDRERVDACYRSAHGDPKPFMLEYRLRSREHKYSWVLMTGVPRFLKDGAFVGYIGSGIDITSRKETEESLLSSNREKDLLIKEVHHRVKNNLQLVSSIIYIKQSEMPASPAKEFLENMRHRIRSISLIHERLLQAGSINKVDMADYLGNLLKDLKMSISNDRYHVQILQVIPSVEMDLDVAINCGLIVNELVTNAFKHAFSGREQGLVKVEFSQLNEGDFELSVSDNGKGLPESISVSLSGTFGMQMLQIFTRQLNGTARIERDIGTTFIINFTISRRRP